MRLYLQKMGVELTWVKGSSIEQYKQAVKSNTKVRRMGCTRGVVVVMTKQVHKAIPTTDFYRLLKKPKSSIACTMPFMLQRSRFRNSRQGLLKSVREGPCK